MAINDLITVGATPLVVQAYWAAGGSDWFGDTQRVARPWSPAGSSACDRLRRGLGRRRDAGAGRHRRGRPHRPGRIACTGLINPEVERLVGRRRVWPPATPSCCWPRAVSMPTGSAWRGKPGRAPAARATSPRSYAGLELRRCAARARRPLYSPVTEALHGVPASRRTTAPTSPATAGASSCATRPNWRYRIHTVPAGAVGAPASSSSTRSQDDREAYGTLQHGRRLRAFSSRRPTRDRTVEVARVTRHRGPDRWHGREPAPRNC